MSKKNTEVILANEAKIVSVVMPDASMEPAGRVNYFHRVTKEAGKLSIAAAFYAGLELMNVKANLTKHGELSQWIASNCDFGAKTAQNYIHVAYMCLSRAGYDCDELIEGSDSSRMKAIEDAADRCESDNLNEIYIDLGIVKKSKSRMGGSRVKEAEANGKKVGRPSKADLEARLQQQEEELGADSIQKRVADLFAAAVTGGGLGNCDDKELASAVDMLKQIVKCGEEIIKSRNGK